MEEATKADLCLTPGLVLDVDSLHSNCDDGEDRQSHGEDTGHTQSHEPDRSET